MHFIGILQLDTLYEKVILSIMRIETRIYEYYKRNRSSLC